jgi:hypothetical protein
MTDSDLIETIPIRFRDGSEPLANASPVEWPTHRVRPEHMFGLLADAIDDEFLEIVLGRRRYDWRKEFAP